MNSYKPRIIAKLEIQSNHVVKPIYFEDERSIFSEIVSNPKIIASIKDNIYVKGIIKDFEEIQNLDESSVQYQHLKSKIINVDETKNPEYNDELWLK